MSRTFTFTVDHMAGRREIELVVTYSVSPGCPPQLYGDCPHPGDDGEVELISITHEGRMFPLSAAEEGALHDMACERSGEDWAEDQAAAAEYRAEQRADDRMMERWESGQ
jgi:hypothetical protein